MKQFFTISFILLWALGPVAGQSDRGLVKGDTLARDSVSLDEFVVTGQFEAQSLKNSVYQVRTIDSERIAARGATNLQSILNTELGIRFSNDLTLGTSDIQLMGMSGQNVKILLDGIPMVDRGSTRESLGQIDINTIERIEIVEGPMSVIYGTDALAGVINLITKKGHSGDNLTLNARIQEETAGKEYNALSGKGTHNESLGITWQNKALQFSGNITRNNFGGWQGNSTGRVKDWMPKDQMLYSASARYQGNKWNVWYRFNGTDETIKSEGNRNPITQIAADKDYNTYRWFHQVQSELKVNEKLHVNGVVSYTDYSRKTLSTNVDASGRETLSLEPGSQDKSVFTTTFFRGTALYKANPHFSLLAGLDFSDNQSSGARILGSPQILEYALFVAPEIKLGKIFKLSPGLRFLKNSVYDAPPAIPSINGKLSLTQSLDLRVGYARGFRSPALRELYFDFHDASHSINGNTNLKAEYSDSFNSFLVWQSVSKPAIRANTTLGGFYNVFHDLIDTGIDPNDPTQTTYLNIFLFKTTGFTVDNKIFMKNLQASLGGSYIGRYNQFSANPEQFGSLPEFVWSPEVNANLLYRLSKIGASLNLFYKFSGKRPIYETTDQVNVRLAETDGFHMADLTFSKNFGKYINLLAGVKNLFDVTSLNNSSTDTGGAHSTGGAVPLSYGRSYFLGLNVQWSRN
ncbi:TonB-dependent receptor [Dyadobacter chenwenxiniae]|uniref:TonB-dependent receptor n=1 Tax=Dyadobacter chenwenxiniae TaxID=2906456 RepID=A0A9X1TE99_9BACT|nr:TonB-dependent receptor [Dyadobacter chenwenxiniae]MCF0061255.1 TonB-dependent receptor [Dyadobacter chenwenxiniae]UON81077.1 TonB-dependent receptor [Dyadobacter chenwenxiniae]